MASIGKTAPREVKIAKLEQDAKGVSVESVKDKELAKVVDAAGTKDSVVTSAEVDAYRATLTAEANKLAAIPNPTARDVAQMQQTFGNLQRAGGLGYEVLERTNNADEWATLAQRIDDVMKERSSGKRIGDGNGAVSADEVKGFIAEMERRIASPTAEDDPAQLKALVEMAQQLLAQRLNV
jgi:hypothetical protein